MYTKQDAEQSRKNILDDRNGIEGIKNKIINTPISKDFTIKDMIAVSIEKLKKSQIYGTFIQDRLIDFLGLKPVSQTEDYGDYAKPNGKRDEFKIVVIGKNRSANVPQLRLWQLVERYLIIAYDPEEDNLFITYPPAYVIKKMCEGITCGCHKTIDAIGDDKKVEKAFTFSKNSNAWVAYPRFTELTKWTIKSPEETREIVHNPLHPFYSII